MSRLFRCPGCNRYTMKPLCPGCGTITVSPHPAKFSISDRYVRYRWILKKGSESDGANSP